MTVKIVHTHQPHGLLGYPNIYHTAQNVSCKAFISEPCAICEFNFTKDAHVPEIFFNLKSPCRKIEKIYADRLVQIVSTFHVYTAGRDPPSVSL